MARAVVQGLLSPSEERPAQAVAVQDVTALLDVRLEVDGFQFDASIMEHAEFLLSTAVTFTCRQYGGRRLLARWRLYRSFQEFQTLDAQLRQAFPVEMHQPGLQHPPRPHRRRAFFRMDRSAKFLARRSAELNGYLTRLLQSSCMRLSRFLDPRAPLVLRHFCNFDAGFARGHISFQRVQVDPYVLCLDNHAHQSQKRTEQLKQYQLHPQERVSDERNAPAPVYARLGPNERHDRSLEDMMREKVEQQNELRRQLQRENRSSSGETADSKLDELQANLLDDRARNMAMCLKFACACQFLTFDATRSKMQRILRLRGLEEACCPPTDSRTGLSALYCVVTRLQEYNDLDKRLYDALTGFPAPPSRSSSVPPPSLISSRQLSMPSMESEKAMHHRPAALAAMTDLSSEQTQILVAVELMRQTLANYALLHVVDLERHFRIAVVDIKKKLHDFKSKTDSRIGAMELVVLATMLNLSIHLVTNDHQGTVHEILPLAGLRPIRKGPRIFLTLGYILPTLYCVTGFYLLATKSARRRLSSSEPTPDERMQRDLEALPASPKVRRSMWQGIDEMDRCFMAEISAVLEEGSAALPMNDFDFDAADTLNRAILDAVWDDCQHNPSLFHLFQRQARQFGQRRVSAGFYVQYLEVAFGLDGMTYLVDFLLHVLPEEALRRQLLRARWRRVRRRISKRVCP